MVPKDAIQTVQGGRMRCSRTPQQQ